MEIAVLTFDGFNEIDSFVASAMLNRVTSPELRALIVCPIPKVKSMNGIAVESQAPLSLVLALHRAELTFTVPNLN